MRTDTEYVLRALRAGDAASAAGLIRASFAAQSVVTDPLPSALRESAESVAATLAAGGGACAEAGEMLVGVVLWSEKDGGLYMGRLAVHPGWRGRGVARALVAAAEAEARRRGMPRLHLSVRLALADNRRLFQACGFRETAMHAHPGYSAPTFVDMEKRLA
ncbi:GNAT family N-acetyltransferase [Limobrevibacterium gyesilva]|uniref:GNAT family N-acetyltransferase n=1 Tax=Limobrevibacterium gyesilva TaxID=2991712 RepID=A0AA41YI61_9PROT|nr:GNAT family N-acetyltransferase [Limobrevibacterium gyesilva]MCW3473379.1 GNAT family N-acetyltransferase [Limobrevibacterium gyesilva]